MIAYRLVSALPWPRRFGDKILVLCFVLIHLPLLGFLAYAARELSWSERSTQVIAGILLLATLIGTAGTLWLVREVLKPLVAAGEALEGFRLERIVPSLPVGGRDEVGLLLAGVQRTVEELNAALGALEREAATDPLTAVGNRRWLFDQLRREVLSLPRGARPLCVVVLDFDAFKAFNDGHGHAVGDAILAHGIALLRAEIRPSDTIGRLGGDEFCILFPRTSLREGVQIAERLRRLLAATPIAGFEAGRVTASFGVAESPPSPISETELLDRADRELYAAKNRGRNRVSPPTRRGEPAEDEAGI